MARFDDTVVTQQSKLKFLLGEETLSQDVHILIVSSSLQFLDSLQKSIVEFHKEEIGKSFKLKVHICRNIADVIQTKFIEFHVDFIVLVVDPNFADCLDEIKISLRKLESCFARDRICLVNNTGNPLSIIKPNEIWEFAKCYQFNVIMGDLLNKEECTNVSERIMNLVEMSCGLRNGFPFSGCV